MSRNRLVGQSLSSLLVVALIIVVAVALVYRFAPMVKTGKQNGGKTPETRLGEAFETARELECLSNLRGWRILVEQKRAERGSVPPTLPAAGDQPVLSPRCPVSGNKYIYDPTTGWVKCPDHPRS
ncbi:MAG: hypothetical protein NZ959_09310 [Armatimonadetes bacterium]|nr:hypothetical protein [Armatimonadota bacterium]MDW8122151.1 hypothetical protein [Armatimonadota bacterium]